MPEDRRMTFIVVPHGHDATTRSFELSYARLRSMAIGGVALVLLGAALVGSWLWMAGQAARVPSLRSEVEQLRLEREKMEELAATLERLSVEYAKVRVMLGADSLALPRIEEGESGADAEPAARQDTATRSSLPYRWPLAARGFTTRRHGGLRGSHPGIDIAVPSGSRILAAAGGTVVQVGEDSVYGRFVRIAHADGYESLYAHAAEVLVRPAERVAPGSVIALSGSTGASTGPHLHFEIRRDGEPVDPGSLIPHPN
jgi:murein DD-endopeptidase MepM/ murein hydrolase activator NlpD